jgi:hypothetical protein
MDTASRRPTCPLASSESSRRNPWRCSPGTQLATALDLTYAADPFDQVAASAVAVVSSVITAAALAAEPAALKEATLGIGIDIFQARFAAGGESVGLDMQASPYRLNSILLKSRAALIAPYIGVESMVG